MKLVNLIKIRISKMDKKKTLKRCGAIFLIALFVIICMYISNKSARNFINKHILRKDVVENDLVFIDLTSENNNNIYAYYKYITILENNTLTNYNSSGKKDSEVKVEVSNPIYESNNQFLLVAEKEGNKINLISGEKSIWSKELEGTISRMKVNRNGYTAVAITGTIYKTVIIVYDQEGKELFKTYLSSSNVMDIEISNDNKFVSFVEINTSGTMIQSYVKTISIEKAKNPKEDAIVSTYTPGDDIIIDNIKYGDKNKLVSLNNSNISVINENEGEKIVDFNEKKSKIADIELNNYIYEISESAVGILKMESDIKFINISNNKENTYLIDGTVKETFSYNEILAANLGSEVYFINTNGWLVKKYTSTQEVQKIVLCNNLAGIVYRDKIELINI